jgi:hypothetical protein
MRFGDNKAKRSQERTVSSPIGSSWESAVALLQAGPLSTVWFGRFAYRSVDRRICGPRLFLRYHGHGVVL